MTDSRQLALEALKESNRQWKQLADSGDAGNWSAEEQEHYQASERAIAALEARIAQKVEPREPNIHDVLDTITIHRVEYKAKFHTCREEGFNEGWEACMSELAGHLKRMRAPTKAQGELHDNTN